MFASGGGKPWVSSAAMLGLIAGLGYGGYALLQDIQQVGFAPLPEAPEVVAERSISPKINENKVLLPEPLGPTRPIFSPRFMFKDTSLKRVLPP